MLRIERYTCARRRLRRGARKGVEGRGFPVEGGKGDVQRLKGAVEERAVEREVLNVGGRFSYELAISQTRCSRVHCSRRNGQRTASVGAV